MKTNVGLWIDHKQAVIVFVAGKDAKTKRISSNLEKHHRQSGAEGNQKQQSETHSSEGDGPQQKNQGRFAGDQTATSTQSYQASPGKFVGHV